MKMNNNKKNQTADKFKTIFNNNISRRTLLKGLGSLPILGLFSYKVMEKQSLAEFKKQETLAELGIDKLETPVIKKYDSSTKNNLIRIGIIGYGSRAKYLAKGLGFMHPDFVEQKKLDNTLKTWLDQENLNVAITGICEVFDLRAEKGLVTARNELQPGGGSGTKLPVKRYRHYHDMLASDDIDAVIIATPEHHHAKMTIDAVRAGKHVYCEKSVTRTEEEVYQIYDSVKNSNIVFQWGHQIPQSTTFKKAKQIIDKNILGKISLIETTTNRNTSSGAWIRHLDKNGNLKPGDEKTIDWEQWLGNRPYVPFSTDRYYNWTKWFDYGTGLLGQLFTHEFDAVNQLLRIGIPKSVVATGGIYNFKDNRETPDILQAVFEYPDSDLTLLYSATLASSKYRGRVFMGRDAWMELGDSLTVTADEESHRYQQKIVDGIINPTHPMFSYRPGSKGIDAVTSATSKYYASRGLIDTYINGKRVDITHLHLKEWLDCIRNGGEPSANIERAFEEGITTQMAFKSFVEKRRVEWDPIKRKIV